MDQQRLDSLDTLRGIAILMVILFHVAAAFAPPPALASVLVFGNQGVQLFFLISAVTMCHMWEQRQNESRKQIKFYIRRAFRIAPLFWFALVFYTLLWGTGPRDQAWDGIGPVEILSTALFLHGFLPSAINAVVPGGWSIAIEMSFYVVFPYLAKNAPNRLLVIAFASYVILGIAGTALFEKIGSGEHFSLFLYYSLLTQFPIFPIGMALYAVVLQKKPIERTPALFLIACWLVVAFAGKYVLGITSRPLFWIQIAAFAASIAVFLKYGLSTNLISFLGKLSYSMYLFHFAVIFLLAKLTGSALSYPAALVIVLGVTIAIAVLSQRTAERWSQNLAKIVIAAIDRSSLPQRSRGQTLKAATADAEPR